MFNCFLKRAAILIAFAFAAASFADAQIEKQVATIRADVNLINKSAAKYTKQKRDVEDISLEGTEATYFLSGKDLKKIVAKMYGESFRATAELYYSGEELIFAYDKTERYAGHFASNPPPKIAKVIETRIYFSNGEAIRVMDGKKVVEAESKESLAEVEAVNDLSSKLKAALDH